MRTTTARRGKRGQALLEFVLVTPLALFFILGVSQVAVMYQTRIVAEYAAFKAARAASVHRLACGDMVKGALAALTPTAIRSSAPAAEQKYEDTLRRLMKANTDPGGRLGGRPLVLVDYQLDTGGRAVSDTFDRPLDPAQRPTEVQVRVIYFDELRIPFANWIIARSWLAAHKTFVWAGGRNPYMVVAKAAAITPEATTLNTQVLNLAEQAIKAGYFTVPVVTTWSMRMMSDPLPGARTPSWRCQ